MSSIAHLLIVKHSQQTFQKQKWNQPVPCKEGKTSLEHTANISFVLRMTHSNVVILDIKKTLEKGHTFLFAFKYSQCTHPILKDILLDKFLLPNLTEETPPPKRSSNSNFPSPDLVRPPKHQFHPTFRCSADFPWHC